LPFVALHADTGVMRNMKKTICLGFLAAVVLLLTGCPEQPAVSLHGLDDATAVTDENIAGSWIVKPASVQVAEEAAEDDEPPDEMASPKRPLRETYVDIIPNDADAGRYTVTITRGRQTKVLDARLVEIAGSRIFDALVVDAADPEDVDPHYHAPHSFFKVEAVDDGITLSYLTQEFLEAHRKKGNLRTPHTLVDDAPVLIGPPEEVQRFIEEFANAGPAANEGWRKMGAMLLRLDAE
jgi:hypothetical protein